MAETPSVIRLFGLVTDSIVDGPGFRVSIFTQGCPHHCEGCHNPGSHDPAAGKEWTLDEEEKKFTGNPLLDGITLTGGGALLRGLDQLIQSETGIDVHIAEDPLDCVAKGAGAVLDHVDVLHDVLDTDGGHM